MTEQDKSQGNEQEELPEQQLNEVSGGFIGGVTVAAADVGGDNRKPSVTPGGHVKVFDGTTGGL